MARCAKFDVISNARHWLAGYYRHNGLFVALREVGEYEMAMEHMEYASEYLDMFFNVVEMGVERGVASDVLDQLRLTTGMAE